LDDVSGGRLNWQKLLDAFWRDFRPKAGEVVEQKPSEITAALDEFLAPWLYPPREDGSDPRVCPPCGNGRLSPRGGKFGAFVACSTIRTANTPKFGQGGDQARSDGLTGLVMASSQDRPLRSLSRTRRQARVDPQGRFLRMDTESGRAPAVAAA
jgi:DNA topoisomerase-1